MKKICMILALCLLVMIPCCKKKLPTQPDIPTKVLPTIEYFHATPTSITIGGVSILSWSTKNATNITINQGVGTVSAKDTVEVSPEETTTYTLTATNSDGQKTQSCKVEVTEAVLNLPIIDYFTASPESIIQGEGSELSWSVQPEGLTEALRIEPLGNLTIPFEGSHTVYPTETTTYTLIAVNDDGKTEASCTIEVILNPPIIEYFIANPTSIKLGDESELSWSVSNADTRRITQNFDPAGLDVDPTGTCLVSPTVTTIFTLTATNDSGQTTSSCEVEILPSAVIELSWVVIYATYLGSDLFEVAYEFDMQESGGVGGQINELAIKISDNKGQVILDYLQVASFSPFSTFSHSARPTMSWAPKLIKVWVNGVDDNGYKFSHDIGWGFSW